ncbi:MAG: hypothetical protein GY719_31645 [bacterium]|nr:hypothetical protein [bacterium]
MKTTLIALAIALSSCTATRERLALFDASLVRLNEAVQDDAATVEDVQAHAIETRERLEEVRDGVKQDADRALGWIEALGAAGGSTTVGGILLHLYRNGTRKRELELIKEEPPT